MDGGKGESTLRERGRGENMQIGKCLVVAAAAEAAAKKKQN